jgi:hypothetical protein
MLALLVRAVEGEAAQLMTARAAAAGARRRAIGEVERAAAMVRSGVQAVVAGPAGPPADLAGCLRYAGTLGQTVALARRRAGLLDEWRAPQTSRWGRRRRPANCSAAVPSSGCTWAPATTTA